MAINKTTSEAYHELLRTCKAKNQTDRVFLALSMSPPRTRRELARLTGIPHKTICSRVKVLLDIGVIHVAGEAPCYITGQVVECLEVNGEFAY